MSYSRKGEEGEAWSGEEDELQQRQPWIPVDQRKVKNKKGSSLGNRRKIQLKAKKFLLSPLRKFDKHLDDTKSKTEATTARRSAPPFPYNGEDFGGSPSRYLCFLRPFIPPSSPSPIHIGPAAGAAETPGAVPKYSSYHDFVKTLIEKNDFYSPECNAHRDVPCSQAK